MDADVVNVSTTINVIDFLQLLCPIISNVYMNYDENRLHTELMTI
jgi:hypothetical protein